MHMSHRCSINRWGLPCALLDQSQPLWYAPWGWKCSLGSHWVCHLRGLRLGHLRNENIFVLIKMHEHMSMNIEWGMMYMFGTVGMAIVGLEGFQGEGRVAWCIIASETLFVENAVRRIDLLRHVHWKVDVSVHVSVHVRVCVRVGVHMYQSCHIWCTFRSTFSLFFFDPSFPVNSFYLSCGRIFFENRHWLMFL